MEREERKKDKAIEVERKRNHYKEFCKREVNPAPLY